MISSKQKEGLIRLIGYSFGGGVAFEMALQLEASGRKVSLVLLDGSPSYVSNYIDHYRGVKGAEQDFDLFKLAYFTMLFTDKNISQVSCILEIDLIKKTKLPSVITFKYDGIAKIEDSLG
jgi:thioesterase domain-containing protein